MSKNSKAETLNQQVRVAQSVSAAPRRWRRVIGPRNEPVNTFLQKNVRKLKNGQLPPLSTAFLANDALLMGIHRLFGAIFSPSHIQQRVTASRSNRPRRHNDPVFGQFGRKLGRIGQRIFCAACHFCANIQKLPGRFPPGSSDICDRFEESRHI